ncbi:glycosyltransferase family 2 protein [Shewanella maritima]|uniref:glycosyltransferase family 2 protein n=1 Tax=Shewanella maritima TaxID=2520507 RepID=UPI003734F789
MIKQKLKRIIKQQLSKDALLNLDFVCKKDGFFICSGWFGHKKLPVSKNLCVKDENGKELGALYTYERSDVLSYLNANSNEQAFGFVYVLPLNGLDVAALTLTHSNTKFRVNKLKFTTVGHPKQIVDNVVGRSDEAKAFISEFLDINWDGAGSFSVPINRDPDIEKVKTILQSVNVNSDSFYDECQKDIVPSLQRVWKARQSKHNQCEVLSYGELFQAPAVSIVIPLYGRYDFMQHQLAQFSLDPAMKNAEVIYVLDDPSLRHEVKITAHGIHQIFGFPFKLVISEFNLGFAGANNLGVKYATAEHLLLLNSDVIPSQSGWLTCYLERFAAIENIGILGATLLYEDDTVQHIGMEFRKDNNYPGIWMNHHPYKGVPFELLQKESICSVPLTTGACMLMLTEQYRELGGFDELYVIGDFEDSDLCLKFIDKGLGIYITTDVVLYHLERLSQDLVDSGNWKFKLTLANGVYQSMKWNTLISEVAK